MIEVLFWSSVGLAACLFLWSERRRRIQVRKDSTQLSKKEIALLRQGALVTPFSIRGNRWQLSAPPEQAWLIGWVRWADGSESWTPVFVDERRVLATHLKTPLRGALVAWLPRPRGPGHDLPPLPGVAGTRPSQGCWSPGCSRAQLPESHYCSVHAPGRCGPTHHHACSCREASFQELAAATRELVKELRVEATSGSARGQEVEDRVRLALERI